MHSEHNQDINLYQVPNCSICLSQLVTDLVNISCGHIYHQNCIRQQIQIRGTCPNCMNRARQQEIRPFYFNLIKNNQTAELMRQVFSSCTSSEKDQVQSLIQKISHQTAKVKSLQYDVKQAQKNLKKQRKQLDDTKTALNKTKNDIQSLKKQNLILRQAVQSLHIEKDRIGKQNFDLTQQILAYRQKDAQYKRYKQLLRKSKEHSKDMIDLKKQMETNGSSDKKIIDTFFDIVLMKNMDIQKIKNQCEGYPEIVAEKQSQIRQIRLKLEKQKKQVKQLKESQATLKKKYDHLRAKYFNLAKKYKQKIQQPISQDDNYEDSLISRPSFPLFNSTNSNVTSRPFIQNQLKQQNIPSNQIKPVKKINSMFFQGIIDEEQIKGSQKKVQNQKTAVQQSLSGFISTKPNPINAFATFGGIADKKKVQEKKSGGMKKLSLF